MPQRKFFFASKETGKSTSNIKILCYDVFQLKQQIFGEFLPVTLEVSTLTLT